MNIVAMAPYERGWSNVELIKDCGLIPYLLYKNHNCDVTMVGAKGTEYTYLETYVKGLKMHLLDDGMEMTKVNYIMENAHKIDGLLLRGCYESNSLVAKTYKLINPNGKIFIGLDANSFWMDSIRWRSPDFTEFMNFCDVISTSSEEMQRHLNRKWPWKIEHIPNGCYYFGKDLQAPVFQEKENIILTVGRLGTYQKSTDKLLEAFALIENEIPDWKLVLVGSVEPEFKPYIDSYFLLHPSLKERVNFTGPITNREKLANLYRKSKIFALSSVAEGGPNVISEALNAGCVVATTRIDAYRESTANGMCGLSCEIGDVKGLSRILLNLCFDPDLEEKSRLAYKYGKDHFTMETIVDKVYEMMFGGNSRG